MKGVLNPFLKRQKMIEEMTKEQLVHGSADTILHQYLFGFGGVWETKTNEIDDTPIFQLFLLSHFRPIFFKYSLERGKPARDRAHRFFFFWDFMINFLWGRGERVELS